MQLRLYSREWCSWCIDAKDFLSEKGYCFQEIDVGKDRQAYEEMKHFLLKRTCPRLWRAIKFWQILTRISFKNF
jgi:Glutaredoxin and related proteins